jgi:hypothetical protein
MGEASMNDKARSQKAVTAKLESHQKCIEEMIQENHQIKHKDITLKLGISKRKSGPHYQSTWILKSLSHEN